LLLSAIDPFAEHFAVGSALFDTGASLEPLRLLLADRARLDDLAGKGRYVAERFTAQRAARALLRVLSGADP
jgi:hypothetical protein